MFGHIPTRCTKKRLLRRSYTSSLKGFFWCNWYVKWIAIGANAISLIFYTATFTVSLQILFLLLSTISASIKLLSFLTAFMNSSWETKPSLSWFKVVNNSKLRPRCPSETPITSRTALKTLKNARWKNSELFKILSWCNWR